MQIGTKFLMIRSAEGKNIKDFSEFCDLSDKNYGEIERNEKSPTPKSLEIINRAISKLGWDLIEDCVVKKEKTFISLKGDDRLQALFEDIESYVGEGGELLIDGADESKTPVKILETVRRLRKQGMTMRHLIKEGDHQLRAPIGEYRWIPQRVFINQAIFIYKNNIAILSENEETIFIHRDDALSRHFRNVFNERWEMYTKPDYSEVTDVFDV
jgi:transcriptional regulator with XRE-family HTH domain